MKQTLEVQGLLDSVKAKVHTARNLTSSLSSETGISSDDSGWALESERILEEKQELISQLIVQSQQGNLSAS